MEFSKFITIDDVEVETETQPGYTSHGALKCCIPAEEKPMWIPKSQVDDRSEVYKAGDKGALMISEWIAEQKGLI